MFRFSVDAVVDATHGAGSRPSEDHCKPAPIGNINK